MTRQRRTFHAPTASHRTVDDHRDFNEQMYAAMKNSPWWLISLAFHALVVVIAQMLPTAQAAPKTEPQVEIAVGSTEEFLQEPIDAEEEIETPNVNDLVVEQPSDVQLEPSKVPEIDTDSDLHQTFGPGTDGNQLGAFDGPSTNPHIGIGGGAGAFRGRGDGGNRDLGDKGGRTQSNKTQDAVEDALRWLAAHQSPDGRWEGAGFDRWCDGQPVEAGRGPAGLGKPMYDVGLTGLALCAFLGAGYTHRGEHPFTKVVGDGLKYLKNVQDPEGCFGARTTQHYIYNHAIAALAMVEAYGMTESPMLKGSAQKALDFIALSRNPYFAWRYGVKPGDNDTSVTGWMMMALKSAKLINEDAAARGKPAPLPIDLEAFEGIRAWVDKMTDKDYGRVGYVTPGSGPARPQELVDRFPTDKSESMTAAGVLARIFIGEDPRQSEMVKKGADLMLKLPPTWNETDGSIDMYYWYYGTLAMFQVGGDAWLRWKVAMERAVVGSQRKDTDFCQYKGSWDPLDPWGPDGGRIYSTAVMAMCLEVYYRYPRVAGTR